MGANVTTQMTRMFCFLDHRGESFFTHLAEDLGVVLIIRAH